jgi:hypothetical protein
LALRRRGASWLREVLGGRYSYDELMALVADLRAELAQAETAVLALCGSWW